MTDHQTTHAPGCWDWGPKHYECAVGQVERDALEEIRDMLQRERGPLPNDPPKEDPQ